MSPERHSEAQSISNELLRGKVKQLGSFACEAMR
jgi:hypothetical protein